ncbi:MAG: ABC transporter substrate-binding protein [Gammaproteobacteria bacterium]|nr:ABC transporter substrate-binding protein [Gammaproteobacteria bacterium]
MKNSKSAGGLSRRQVLKSGVTTLMAGAVGFPAIIRAQSDTIRIGHITPRSGFLGTLGDYGFRGVNLAVEEINAAGGVLGREVDLFSEDSVGSAVAPTKAQKLIERRDVHFLIGEISSGSGGGVMATANRLKTLYMQTGCNSDALRGEKCNRYTFHVEAGNTMYTKTIGNWQHRAGNVQGKKFYMLTADYAFGHDLARVSTRFLTDKGGIIMANELIATGTPDYSPYILKIKAANPDFVYINLAGADQTTFLKQYKEYGLPFKVSGGVMDTAQFWGAGIESITGYWQSLWYHGLNTDSSNAFTAAFTEKYKKPPENQAWGDYIGVKIMAQAMEEAKTTDSRKLIALLESGMEFDILKPRQGQFRKWDHSLLQQMFVVKVKDKADMSDKWDIFEVVEASPGDNEPLGAIQPTKDENLCKMG